MKSIGPWLVVAACLLLPVYPDPPLFSGAYVQHVTASSAVIAKIDPAPRALALRVVGSDGAAVAELGPSAPRRRHAFAVDGLQAGATYRFELLDGGRAVDGGEFSTAPGRDDRPVRFAVVGDSGGTPWWVAVQQSPLFYALARFDLLPAPATAGALGGRLAAGDPDLWFHVGDLVYPRGRHRHYRPGFFLPFAEALRRAPCYAVVGNHDLMDDDGRQLDRNLHQPENELTGDERYFTVVWGPVRFVGLELSPKLEPDHLALRYLDLTLEGSAEPWRIVFAHYPMYSAGRHGDRADLIEHLLPRLQAHRVDLFFAGHDHNYQRFGPEGGTTLVVTGGGGKSLYDLRPHAKVVAARSAYHVCQVEVDGARLRLEAIDVDGETIDAFELDLAEQAAARPGFDPAKQPRDRRIQALLGPRPLSLGSGQRAKRRKRSRTRGRRRRPSASAQA